jgi:hypothetical protein
MELIPNEILYVIFTKLDLFDRLNFGGCCKQIIFLRNYIKVKKCIKTKTILRHDWIEIIKIYKLISFDKFINLKIIRFDKHFNQPVNNLPENLKVIKFGYDFN